VVRGVSLLRGPAFGGGAQGLALARQQTLADGAADAVRAAIDEAQPRRRPDERVLFRHGYEASLALDARAPRRAGPRRASRPMMMWSTPTSRKSSAAESDGLPAADR
jgi:hypothetical protein